MFIASTVFMEYQIPNKICEQDSGRQPFPNLGTPYTDTH